MEYMAVILDRHCSPVGDDVKSETLAGALKHARVFRHLGAVSLIRRGSRLVKIVHMDSRNMDGFRREDDERVWVEQTMNRIQRAICQQ